VTHLVRRLPRELAILPVLALTRALPEIGLGLYLRLAAATLCLLLPGLLLARAIGRPSVSAPLVWSLTGIFAAGAVMFAAHGSLDLALGLYVAIGVAALVAVLRRSVPAPRPRPYGILLLGVVLGALLWHVAGTLDGDALFHLARLRKLEAFSSLHLRTVDEFRDGGLHPGYAFPLWHVLLALVAKVAGVDPARVLLHEASILCPLALAVVYEAGTAVFRSAAAAFAVVLATVAVIAFAPGHGGAYVSLALPATAARQLLVPAAIALFFLFVRSPTRADLAAVAAAGLALALVHPTYALFVVLPLAGYVGARALIVRGELRQGLAGLAALVVPAGAVSLWLLPIVRETASHDPSDADLRTNLAHYGNQLVVYSLHSYRMAAEVFARTGAVAVAALVTVPLAALAPRRRWAALVLGGTIVIAALALVPPFFTTFSDLVSLSQARRAVGFIPLAFAFAGAATVLAGALGVVVLPVALAAGIALELVYPGDFGYSLEDGGPALVAWMAAVGAAAALAVAIVWRRPRRLERRGGLTAAAALLFVLPVAVSGFANWTPRRSSGAGLTAGLVRALHENVPAGAVVFTDDATGYRIAAATPVYVNAALPGHVANTTPNHPYERREDAQRFLRTGSLAIPRRYGARWIVIDRRRRPVPSLSLPRLYRDGSYSLYRLSG
jgi:hypothetical protein